MLNFSCCFANSLLFSIQILLVFYLSLPPHKKKLVTMSDRTEFVQYNAAMFAKCCVYMCNIKWNKLVIINLILCVLSWCCVFALHVCGLLYSHSELAVGCAGTFASYISVRMCAFSTCIYEWHIMYVHKQVNLQFCTDQGDKITYTLNSRYEHQFWSHSFFTSRSEHLASKMNMLVVCCCNIHCVTYQPSSYLSFPVNWEILL